MLSSPEGYRPLWVAFFFTVHLYSSYATRSRSVLSDAIPESYRLSFAYHLQCDCGLSMATVYHSIFLLSILFFHSLKNQHFRQIVMMHIVQIALSYKCNYFHHSNSSRCVRLFLRVHFIFLPRSTDYPKIFP